MASRWAMPESFNAAAAVSAAPSFGKTASMSWRCAISRSPLLSMEAREAPDQTVPGTAAHIIRFG